MLGDLPGAGTGTCWPAAMRVVPARASGRPAGPAPIQRVRGKIEEHRAGKVLGLDRLVRVKDHLDSPAA